MQLLILLVQFISYFILFVFQTLFICMQTGFLVYVIFMVIVYDMADEMLAEKIMSWMIEMYARVLFQLYVTMSIRNIDKRCFKCLTQKFIYRDTAGM